MNFDSMVNELLALASELDTIDREYQFARGRADAHRERALQGDQQERWLYCGAKMRMIELQERAGIIEERITLIEQDFEYQKKDIYF